MYHGPDQQSQAEQGTTHRQEIEEGQGLGDNLLDFVLLRGVLLVLDWLVLDTDFVDAILLELRDWMYQIGKVVELLEVITRVDTNNVGDL